MTEERMRGLGKREKPVAFGCRMCAMVQRIGTCSIPYKRTAGAVWNCAIGTAMEPFTACTVPTVLYPHKDDTKLDASGVKV